MSAAQQHWDARAAANFMLGGGGSGLMVAALFVPDPRLPVVLSLLLVATGLTAVWLEIGRKLRAAHVLFNPFTGPQTRAWLMEKVTGEGTDDYTYTPPASTNASSNDAAA